MQHARFVKLTDNIHRFVSSIREEASSYYETGINLKLNGLLDEAKASFMKVLDMTKHYEYVKEIDHDVLYESLINVALLTNGKNDKNEVGRLYGMARDIYPDRSEPHHYYGLYLASIGEYEESYNKLCISYQMCHDDVKEKYPTSLKESYGKYVATSLSEVCYHMGRYKEAIEWLEQVKNDADFAHMRKHIVEQIFSIQKKMYCENLPIVTGINRDHNVPSICFVTMCKNEELCIRDTLEHVYRYIDYWIVCDTGSTDNTCKIVTDFFQEKNIPGELYVDEWVGFDHNKTLMFERAYNTNTDYVLHLDADDHLIGNLDASLLINDKSDAFMFNYKRGTCEFLCSSLYRNDLKWKYVGVAHNIIVCLDKEDVVYSELFVNNDLWIDNEERGFRKMDPEKYLKDAINLKKQFFDTAIDDPYGINSRSAFYTAQSYFDYGDFEEALKWYSLYLKLKNIWDEEMFECHLRIAKCKHQLNYNIRDVIRSALDASDIFADRAEPYEFLGSIHMNINFYEVAYHYYDKAKVCDLNDVKKKYRLFVNKYSYGKYLCSNMVEAGLHLTDVTNDKLQELLDEIKNDIEFSNESIRIDKYQKILDNAW